MTKRQTNKPTTTTKAPDRPTERPRNPFLETKDINRQGTTKIKFTGVIRTYHSDRGVSLIFEVQVGSTSGPYRDYSVMIGKRSYITMQQQLGKDLGQWAGRTLEVECDPSGRYVNPHDPEAPPASTPAPVNRADDDVPF